MPAFFPLSAPPATLQSHLAPPLKRLRRDVVAEVRALEFKTYTWEVLFPELKNDSVVTQLVRDYEWCLNALKM